MVFSKNYYMSIKGYVRLGFLLINLLSIAPTEKLEKAKLMRKAFLLLTILAVLGLESVTGQRSPNTITVLQIDQSTGTGILYAINDKCFSVTGKNFQGAGTDTVLFERDLAIAESSSFFQFVDSLNVEKLDNNYNYSGSGLIADGDIKVINFQLSGKPFKKVRINNCYQKQLVEMFDRLNTYLPNGRRIVYTKN